MFTGIIDHCGKILTITHSPPARHLWIQHSFQNLTLGESIAIDGVCLTVTGFRDDTFSCDVSAETLKLTTLKNYQIGQTINLERALQLSSRLSGHFVMGHVDQTVKVKSVKRTQAFREVIFGGLRPEATLFLLKKGSIAINGVSLTINAVTEDGFSVMLIPHSLALTNLASLHVNDEINIEFDMLARLVAKQLEMLKHE